MSTEYCSDCDYCGNIKMVVNDPWGGVACGDCLKNIESKIEGGEPEPANRHKAEPADLEYEWDSSLFDENGDPISRPYGHAEYDDEDFYYDNREW